MARMPAVTAGVGTKMAWPPVAKLVPSRATRVPPVVGPAGGKKPEMKGGVPSADGAL
ncbi:MAG: hypothetical protein U1F43_38075 [Myxococcota bacterium]